MVVEELMKLVQGGLQDGGETLEIDHGECHLLFEMADKEFGLSMAQKTQLVSGIKELVAEAVERLGLVGKATVEEQVSSILVTFRR